MDEENNNQNQGLIKKAGNMAAKAAKDQAKKAVQQVFKKMIMTIVTAILPYVAAGLAIIIIITSILAFLGERFSIASKEANAFAVDYSSSAIGATKPNRIIVNTDEPKNGAYELVYEFEDENGEIYIGDDALENIKNDLVEENGNLDTTKFTASELKVIGTLMYNGLNVEDYTEEELKALVVFTKVDIAGQSFDLRENEEELTLDDLRNKDEIYGNIQVHRTKLEDAGNGNAKYNEIKLEYIPYGDESTPNTFCYLVAQNNLSAIDKFSVDEEGNLVIAKWSSNKTEYTYLDKSNNKLSNTDKEKLPKDIVKDNTEENYISVSKFEYKQYITKYMLTYGVLSDLLITTDNVDFCLDLAETALNSKLVINIKEELTSTVVTTTTDYVQTTLLYDYIKYEVAGQAEEIKQIEGGQIEQPLEEENGYILLDPERNFPPEGELIKPDESKDYTGEEVFEYTVVTKSTSQSNKYDFEISQIDTWYLKYDKEYNTPSYEQIPKTNTASVPGEFSDETEIVLETVNKTQIEKDEHVQDFIPLRIMKYKADHPGAIKDKIYCLVTYLKTSKKTKIDSTESTTTTTTIYKFGEEVADTTEVTLKNVEYVGNVPKFTKEDENGEPEEGFLYVYDKYIQLGEDLFLQDDSEKQLFSLLELDSITANSSNIIKYLLYIYDGVDRGITNLNVTIFDINSFKGINGSSTENFIKAWENYSLWTYETNQSEIFPTKYLTEDGLNYIVYEDGSGGHNNIAYGWATFINSKSDEAITHSEYGLGYYNWKEEFAEQGIIVEDLYEGACVDKLAADAVFQNEILPTFQKIVDQYLANNLSEYTFSQSQKDALISMCYQYGNINGFADAYINSLDDEGNVDAEKLKTNYSRFNYKSLVNDRKYANWLLFTQGIYIDRQGNEITTRKNIGNWDGDIYSSDKYTFPVYNQYDRRWSKYPFGGPQSLPAVAGNGGKQRTIASSGCGCCSVAAIISGYLGELITPDILTQKLDELYPSGSYYVPGVGSAHFYMTSDKVLGEYGCSGESTKSKEKALEALKSGFAVIGGETGHILAYVPVSSEDAALGYVFRIIDSARGHNVLCRDFEDANLVVDGNASVIGIIYPPGYEN